VILATIRADATVASEIDCFCDPTVFALISEEAATLVLAGQHLVGFVDFDIAEVVFFRKAKCSPVEIVIEYVFDRRETSVVKQRRTMMRYVPGVKMSGCTSYSYSWVEIIIDAERTLGYSVYTIKKAKRNHG
jgi:hypothetical protein